MNAGAAVASGDALVFLHADVEISPAAWSALQTALTDPTVIGGAFRRRFDSPSWILAIGSLLADVRGTWLHVYLGDQAIFARRGVFLAAGGYASSLLFEDLEFSRRLARLGRTVLIGEPVLASSRRFVAEGNGMRLFKNLCLTMAYALGIKPDHLARYYYPEARGSSVPGGAPPAASPGGEGAGTSAPIKGQRT